MTRTEFWKTLESIGGWYQTAAGEIRRTPRGYSRWDSEVCPICAVYNKKQRMTKEFLNAWKAGNNLGLDSKFIDDIMDAADSHMRCNRIYRRRLEKLVSKNKK